MTARVYVYLLEGIYGLYMFIYGGTPKLMVYICLISWIFICLKFIDGLYIICSWIIHNYHEYSWFNSLSTDFLKHILGGMARHLTIHPSHDALWLWMDGLPLWYFMVVQGIKSNNMGHGNHLAMSDYQKIIQTVGTCINQQTGWIT